MGEGDKPSLCGSPSTSSGAQIFVWLNDGAWAVLGGGLLYEPQSTKSCAQGGASHLELLLSSAKGSRHLQENFI